MSLALARAPLRKAAFSGARSIPRAQLRSTFRKYTTPPPPPAPKSNKNLLYGLGAVAGVGALAFYFYSNSRSEAETSIKSAVQAAKVKANFVPTKNDYQKVQPGLCGSKLARNLTLFFLQGL